MFGRSHTQRNGTRSTSYFCSRAYNKRDCTKHRIPGERIETVIIERLRETVLQDDYVANVVAGLREQSEVANAGLEEDIRQKRAELGTVRREITNLSNAIRESGHTRSLLKLLEESEQAETDLLSQVAALERKRTQSLPEINHDKMVQQLARFDHIMQSGTPQDRRALLKMFVKSISMDRSKTTLYGSIEVFIPPDDTIQDFAPGQIPAGGKNTVRILRDPSGPPQYTHSIEYCARRKKPRSR